MTPKKILLVEDDKDVRHCLVSVLKTVGYDVAEAENGLRALEWLKAADQAPAGVILDIMMPVMDGHEFLRQLRSGLPKYDSLPIIVISAKEDFKEIVSDIPGLSARIAKPFILKDLITLMEKVFGKPEVKRE